MPVQWIEIAFHTSAAILLTIAARRGIARGRRLAIYVAIYALLRFVLEEYRPHPPVLLGLTYYQCLAIALFALGSVTAIRRWRKTASNLGVAGAGRLGGVDRRDRAR